MSNFPAQRHIYNITFHPSFSPTLSLGCFCVCEKKTFYAIQSEKNWLIKYEQRHQNKTDAQHSKDEI